MLQFRPFDQPWDDGDVRGPDGARGRSRTRGHRRNQVQSQVGAFVISLNMIKVPLTSRFINKLFNSSN